MPNLAIPEAAKPRLFPLRAVVDSCIFPHVQAWLKPILEDARLGYVLPLWSPLILAESNRTLTWLWLTRHGGDLSAESRRRCSEAAKQMFTHLTTAFRIVEDCPPLDLLWSRHPADDWDAPIWTAAIRSRAHFIVSENLEHGPPETGELRTYGGVYLIHPSDFIQFIDWLADVTVATRLPIFDGIDLDPDPSALDVPVAGDVRSVDLGVTLHAYQVYVRNR